jgi:16S rRNA (guanine966-N2)-methyltransferase
MPRRQPASGPRRPPGSVRIIGGSWRGRRIEIVDGVELRPTPDRVRETLFNWLMPVLPGARCLDLYAGTGALGLEALSRGAAESWFVERDPSAAAAIDAMLLRLGGPAPATGKGRVVASDAKRWLKMPPAATFDVVFLDPPYAANNLGDLCTLLARGWLAAHAWVYLETSRSQSFPLLPEGWQWHRESQAGDVRYALATVRSTQS